MSDRNQHDMTTPAERSAMDFGLAIVFGVGFGLILGLIVDNTGMGLATGLSLATVVNAYNETRRKEKNAGIALAISLGGLFVVILLWILTALGWF